MELIRLRRSAPARRDVAAAPVASLGASAPLAEPTPTRVFRTVKTFSRPRWLALHVLVIALTITMILLGRWQLHVSDSKHFDLQNFIYAWQWWIFTAFGLFMWVRIMRDHLRTTAEASSSADATGELVVRTTPGAGAGPAWLTSPAEAGVASTVYLGYVIPDSATTPARSEGDSYNASYNDYLWQLALADTADQPRPQRRTNPAGPKSTPPAAIEHDDPR